MESNIIANTLKWHRENLEFTAKEVSINIGITQSMYSKIENGKRLITLIEFKKIAELYNMTMEELLIIPKLSKDKV